MLLIHALRPQLPDIRGQRLQRLVQLAQARVFFFQLLGQCSVPLLRLTHLIRPEGKLFFKVRVIRKLLVELVGVEGIQFIPDTPVS